MSVLKLFETVSNKTDSNWITGGCSVQWRVIDKVLYFQQSNGTEDWKSNFNFRAIEYRDGLDIVRVHNGFLTEWLSVKEAVEKCEFTKIVGYSLGAAIATLCAKSFYNRTGESIDVITFGNPRVYYKPEYRVFMAFNKAIRYENPRDIVANVPFPWMGFDHVSHRYVLTTKAKRGNTPIGEWLSGHSPAEYTQRLEGL